MDGPRKHDSELSNNELFDRYEPLAYKFAHNFERSPIGRRLGTPDDILQETFTCMWKAVLKYDRTRLHPKTKKPLAFSTYAYRVVPQWIMEEARQQGLITIPREEHCARKQRIRDASDRAMIPGQLDQTREWPEPTVEELPRLDEDVMELRKGLAKINPALRKVLQKRYKLGCKGVDIEKSRLKQMAKQWKVSRDWIRQLENKGIEELRQALTHSQQ
jgi:RNA polymerase sigma factor (sigma-70 family)